MRCGGGGECVIREIFFIINIMATVISTHKIMVEFRMFSNKQTFRCTR